MSDVTKETPTQAPDTAVIRAEVEKLSPDKKKKEKLVAQFDQLLRRQAVQRF